MINLLIAIDGTESKGYSRRWIEEFYNAFEVSSENGGASMNKYYNPGPYIASWGERNCKEIYLDCTIWLARAIILHYSHYIKKKDEKNLQNIRERELNKYKPIGKTGGYYNLFDILKSFENSGNIEKFVNEKIQINIVGHSRGGHVAIALNNSIPFKVFFLGLLDPVDRDVSLVIDTTQIKKENVKNIFHAVRSNEFANISSEYRGGTSTLLDTREWFGYDGGGSNNKYITSHGGVGGSPIGAGTLPLVNDITCNITYTDPFQTTERMILNQYYEKRLLALNDTLTETKRYNILFKNQNMLDKINIQCMSESNRVRNDFFNAAKRAGLKLANNN